MTIKTRLQKIETNMRNSNMADLPILTLLKIENWIYKTGKKEPINLQKWDIYKKRTLRNSQEREKTKVDLVKLEEKIRLQDGFMEIEFV